MPARLIEALNTTEQLAEIFSDQSVLRAMLQFEVSLAQAEARIGVIPKSAAKAIASAAQPDRKVGVRVQDRLERLAHTGCVRALVGEREMRTTNPSGFSSSPASDSPVVSE